MRLTSPHCKYEEPDNAVLRRDDRGRIRQRVTLPAEVSTQVSKWGLEGVTATGTGTAEVLYVALQRPLFSSVAETTEADRHLARIGRYQVATGTWTWFTYPLASVGTKGDWIGLSEVTAVDANALAPIERDLNDTHAAVKVGKKVSSSKKSVRRCVKVTIKVSPAANGKVVLRDRGKKVATATVKSGRATVTLKLKRSKHSLTARCAGTTVNHAGKRTRRLPSKSRTTAVRVR